MTIERKINEWAAWNGDIGSYFYGPFSSEEEANRFCETTGTFFVEGYKAFPVYAPESIDVE